MSRNLTSYAQNQEDLFVLNYFKGFKCTLLEIGANDGHTLSNSLLLIENGWKAHLLEPGEICAELMYLHEKNDNVVVHNYGIGAFNGPITFYQSGAHVPGGSDKGLVSTTLIEETIRWEKSGVDFKEVTIQLLEWMTFWDQIGFLEFDFISIDAEGMDWIILQQIDLELVGCKCLCIEWNGDPELSTKFTQYCKGYKLAHINNENLIFIK